MKIEKNDLIMAALLVIMIALGMYYSYWQYGICMEKFDDFWYCLKHAL